MPVGNFLTDMTKEKDLDLNEKDQVFIVAIKPSFVAVVYDAVSDVVESGVHWRSNFQIGSRVLKNCYKPILMHIYGVQLAEPAWLRDFPRKETECGLLGQAAFSNLFFVTCHRESCWSARAGQYFQPCQSFIQPPVSCACPVASGTTKPTKHTLLVS